MEYADYFIFASVFLSNVNIEDSQFIVGGNEVQPAGKWPMMCSLQFQPLIGDFSHTCGCVLVDEQHVLTAAHCVSGYDEDRFHVILGAHDVITQLEGQPETYELELITMNPEFQYDPNQGYPNDTAVLRLTQPANIGGNEHIALVQMADPDEEDFVGQECYIVGWGATQGIGSSINILREAEMDVITNDYCKEFFGSDGDRWIGDDHICVIDDPNMASGSCFGDSGGPLLCRATPDDPWILAGTTSWGYASCSTDYPSVYARTSYARDWIDNVIQAN